MTNEHSIFTAKKDILAELMLNGFISAYEAHSSLFENVLSEVDFQPPLSISLAYLTEAHNAYLVAETYYKDNEEILGERYELSEAINKFKLFNDEFMSNVRTNHSHQWTDIKFREFAKAFRNAANLLSLENADYWINKALADE